MPTRQHPTTQDALKRYADKRDFTLTPEPSGAAAAMPRTRSTKAAKADNSKQRQGLRFVIQKHWATRLHYDFRLQMGGVLVSWAVPKGPSYDPKDKRMAIHVEDHPLDYGGFEGTIPPKQYGAGEVIVWDAGTWEPVGDAHDGMAQGKLVFRLRGQKLAGLWELVRIAKPGERQEPWLLFKKKDEWAQAAAAFDVVTALPDSVLKKPLGLMEQRQQTAADAPAKPADAPAAAESTAGDASAPDSPDAPDAPDAPDSPEARRPNAAVVAAAAVSPSGLPGAVKRALPDTLAPQLATLVAAPPPGAGWLIENKFDGYRVTARIAKNRVQLFTRGGHDWSDKLPALVDALAQLDLHAAWLDGEIVVLNADGVPDFNALQNAFKPSKSRPATNGIVYFLFDVPFCGGYDLRAVPLVQRRQWLQQLLAGAADNDAQGLLRFSHSFDAPAQQMLEAACGLHMEGVMLKRADAPYVSTRSDTWLKLKCVQRQEFIVIGFIDRANAPQEVGSVLLGYHDGSGKTKAVRYAGNVGTGWDAKTRKDLHARLVQLEVQQPTVPPADVKPGRWATRAAGQERWVKPELVIEVAFAEWTPDGHVRHGSFKGVREDKPASAVKREMPAAVRAAPATAAQAIKTVKDAQQTAGGKPAEAVESAKAADSAKAAESAESQKSAKTAKTSKTSKTANASKPVKVTASTLKVTHPDRVIDASTGIQKIDLVRYYEHIAERLLPHLKARPVSLVRAPSGIDGALFFQKHAETRKLGLKELDPALWPDHAALLEVDSAQGLLAAVQMNTVEFHTWNSTTRSIDKPDRMVFDLDPGDGLPWPQMQEGAQLMQALLAELKLQCWLKTSGGKGLHVVVPLAPRWSYPTVKRLSQAIVQHLALTIPQRFVAKSGPANRVGKIFVDYLRNGLGQTTASAFSARARPGMGVSMPVAWEQLPDLTSGAQWTVRTARDYLNGESSDPWADMGRCRQTVVAAMQALDFKPEKEQRKEQGKKQRKEQDADEA